jgi:hypothetical protein
VGWEGGRDLFLLKDIGSSEEELEQHGMSLHAKGAGSKFSLREGGREGGREEGREGGRVGR